MAYLWVVTGLWAFSFSLIGVYLSPYVDAYIAVTSRAFLASLIFLPFIRFKLIPAGLAIKLMFIGGLQLGVMYLCLYQSFQFLTVPEVLLFTIFTPFYISLTNDVLARRFSHKYLLVAALAVLGAGVMRYNQLSNNYLAGFLLLQVANLSFGLAQVSYKHLMKKVVVQQPNLSHKDVFGYFYLGALIVSVIGLALWGDFSRLPTTTSQWLLLLYLGVIASGLGYFLWNKGATLVDAGSLAIMNNALIPAGLVVNLVIWQTQVDWLKLISGSAIIVFALWLNANWVRAKPAKLIAATRN